MRFLALSLFLAPLACAQSAEPRFITSDIANFWKAYDASTPANRAAVMQKLYLDPGSPGLKAFLEARIESAQALANQIDRRSPKFYATVRPYTLKVDEQIPTIRKYLARFRELYPDASFPPVYFVIGRVTSGGTTADAGLLIGTEVSSLGPGVDTSEIAPSFIKAMGTSDHLPLMVIHELTHTQRKRDRGEKIPPLLSQSIGEGAADFMTELIANSSINAYQHDYADSRHDEIFARFERDLRDKPADASNWLYNYSQVKGEPADLGYWIGAQICRSFYEKSADKAAAIRAIVRLEDIAALVRASRYASLLAAR